MKKQKPTTEDYLYDDLSRLIWETRNEPGLSIKQIAKIFRRNFSIAEMEILIDDLKKELKEKKQRKQ